MCNCANMPFGKLENGIFTTVRMSNPLSLCISIPAVHCLLRYLAQIINGTISNNKYCIYTIIIRIMAQLSFFPLFANICYTDTMENEKSYRPPFTVSAHAIKLVGEISASLERFNSLWKVKVDFVYARLII